MHIPDGFLDTKTAAAAALFSLAGLANAMRQLKLHLVPRQVPLMGLAAAFVFTAQMLNFPVAGGTSGHMVGAVLTAVLLGPSAAVIVISSVLIVQCFLFADGGVISLGANIFNMAIVSSIAGYAIYRAIFKLFKDDRGQLIAVAFASWCSTVLASVCCAGELAWSGTARWAAVFPAMANIHMIIGLGEGLITTMIIAAVKRARPDILDWRPLTRASYGSAIVYGLVIILGLLFFVSPFTSAWPDGLEKVAASLGFENKAFSDQFKAPSLGDYRMPGIGSPVAATALAGIVGAVVVFILAILLSRLLIPKSSGGSSNASEI